MLSNRAAVVSASANTTVTSTMKDYRLVRVNNVVGVPDGVYVDLLLFANSDAFVKPATLALTFENDVVSTPVCKQR